jgi:hypothetical protein
LAKAEFRDCMDRGSELCNVVTRLMGKAAVEAAADGVLVIEPLENMDVEIEINHKITSRREEYEYPLVEVVDIQKPGSMCLTEYEEANQ